MEKLAILGGTPVCEKKLEKKPNIGKEELLAVARVLKKGILSKAGRGEKVREFEKKFSKFHNVNYALTTTSGTTALHTALAALNIGKNDEVIVPALTFVSSASVILQQGARPVFVDIDARNLCMDIKDLKKKITKKTKAIIVVHMYGSPAEMDEIKIIADEYNLKIVEDCAQAHGALYKGKLVGTLGDIACYSFYQTKNMTCGEGGMVITNSEKLYNNCRSIADHGIVDGNLFGYDYDRLGYNYHLSEIQASIGIEQLKKLKLMNKERRRNATLYRKLLSDVPITFQEELLDISHVYYVLTALLPEKLKSQRDWFVDAVRAENVEINKIYPLPLHRTSLFLKYGLNKKYTNAEDIASRLFNFYTNPGISKKYIEFTCKAVKKVLNHMLYEE